MLPTPQSCHRHRATALTQHFQFQKQGIGVNFIVVVDPSPTPSIAPTSEGKMGACYFIRPTKRARVFFGIIRPT
jgi:hypothetical protein